MNSVPMVQAMLERAQVVPDEARYLYERQRWNLVVRRCQERVELALKAALLWAGAEVPRIHDVGPILKREAARFPPAFREQIPRLASISRSLRVERELSFYGDDQSGIPAEDLYDEIDARARLQDAEMVLRACQQIPEPL